MRISVITSGSEGDTRPLASLCRGLLDRDHQVKLFADDSTLTLPRTLDVPCEALQGNVKSIVPIGDPQQKLQFRDLLRIGKDLKAFIADNSTAWLRAVSEHAARSDAILFSSLALSVGIILREELGKTGVQLAFQPGMSPTREFPVLDLAPWQLPGWLNLWTHRLMRRQMWSLFDAGACRARREVFGTTVTGRPVIDFPVLYGVSRELVAQPADWPADHLICGHWCSRASGWKPPQELLDFIGDEPPMYIGFGSASGFVRTPILNALIDAVAGARAVFSPGWSRINRSVLPDNFFIARDVPHEWLFPRVSLAIHHGGAGTTHTAARAGVPQIILPFGSDQFFWAARLAAQGVAPRTSRRAATSARAIARMIAFARQGVTRQRALDLGQAMAREDGVHRTVCEIETLVERGGRR
jgi:hypothetical protein